MFQDEAISSGSARGRHCGIDRDLHPLLVLVLELDGTVHHGEESVVAAAADILARVELGAALLHQDVAGDDLLAAVALDAEVLRIAGAAVAARAYAFLVCHIALTRP